MFQIKSSLPKAKRTPPGSCTHSLIYHWKCSIPRCLPSSEPSFFRHPVFDCCTEFSYRNIHKTIHSKAIFLISFIFIQMRSNWKSAVFFTVLTLTSVFTFASWTSGVLQVGWGGVHTLILNATSVLVNQSSRYSSVPFVSSPEWESARASRPLTLTIPIPYQDPVFRAQKDVCHTIQVIFGSYRPYHTDPYRVRHNNASYRFLFLIFFTTKHLGQNLILCMFYPLGVNIFLYSCFVWVGHITLFVH